MVSPDAVNSQQIANLQSSYREDEGGGGDRDQGRDGGAGEAPDHEALEGGGRGEAEDDGGRVEGGDVEEGHGEAGGERGRPRQAGAVLHRRRISVREGEP